MIDNLIRQMIGGAKAAAIRWLKSKIPALITVTRDPRRSLSEREKRQVFSRDRGKCRYCGRDTLMQECEIDHVWPWARGGETTIENSVVSCRSCNHHKRDKTGIWPLPLGLLDRTERIA